MDKKQVIDIVRQYKQLILPRYEGAKVYLYGSYGNGTAGKDSDIDVAVVVPRIKGDWFSTIPPLWAYARQVNSLIEPVLMEENEHSPLYDDVLRYGVAV